MQPCDYMLYVMIADKSKDGIGMDFKITPRYVCVGGWLWYS